MSALNVAQRNALVYARVWRGSILFTFLTPMLFLGAMGLGIGSLVREGGSDMFGEGGYIGFFSTGLLAATCMNTAVFEMSWPVLSKIRWGRNYEAMISTPMSVGQIAIGELLWLLARLGLVAVPFYFVLLLFDVPRLPSAPLAIPAAMLTGLAFGAAMLTYTSSIERDDGFNWIFRFVITPLFLFSGTFFPLDELPGWAVWIANATPLYHGIELVRGLILDGISFWSAVWHAGYLLAALAFFTWFTIRQLTKRLVK